jgi:tRNA (cytidine/uridine-2'-O-)-methyltransferase
MDEKAVRRAGLDYWPEVSLERHADLEQLQSSLPTARFLYFSTRAERSYLDWNYQTDDCLVFGRETRGLPIALLKANWERCLKVPILNPHVRSLNLANTVAIVLYEALRQTRAIE